MSSMTINEVYKYLSSYGKSGKPVENLSRIRSLLSQLGDPQEGLRFIHVAGTNGKGSICEMLTEILLAQGYKVGTFTSPYIIEYADRIRINKRNIPEHYLTRHAQRVKECAAKTPYGGDFSQFEITMCIALLHFKECGCDVVVWETGVGGLNDCTNVISSPLVSVIASVSYDHTAVLGDTLEAIAAQKAGIIKTGCPVVLSAGNGKTVEDVVRMAAICKNSKLTIPRSENIKILSDTLDCCEFTYMGKTYSAAMCGAHQAYNAVTVIEALRACRYSLSIDDENITAGISRAKIRARAEVISSEPLIILDGGHNPDGFRAIANIIETKAHSPVTVMLGMLRDKNAAQSVRELIPLCDMFITVDGFYPSAISAPALAEDIRKMGGKAVPALSVQSGLEMLRSRLAEIGGTGIICGSLYLASEVLRMSNQL